ncbi:hypothetical protein Lal_00049450 [Lupinus albus]|nr:hypothetical protein Lal_00049450 [Lupinus albus]
MTVRVDAAMAAIGGKEWYFYVPRDRKYKNGDRPNRVTTSGYWKATGADRMIRTLNFRSIGLKKTLVFYSGKAPKGIRTSWIMNEYRLPRHDTQRYQKRLQLVVIKSNTYYITHLQAEISLCRVYKRAGVEDHPSLPHCVPISDHSNDNINVEMIQQNQYMGSSIFVGKTAKSIINQQQIRNIETEGIKTTNSNGLDHHHHLLSTALGLSNHNDYHHRARTTATTGLVPVMDHKVAEEEQQGLMMNMMMQLQHHSKPSTSLVPTIFPSSSNNINNDNVAASATIDDLNRLLTYQHQQQCYNNNNHLSTFLIQPPPPASSLPNSLPATFSDHPSVWEWNPFPDQPNRDYSNMFFK